MAKTKKGKDVYILLDETGDPDVFRTKRELYERLSSSVFNDTAEGHVTTAACDDVRVFCGREIVVRCSTVYEIEEVPNGQD